MLRNGSCCHECAGQVSPPWRSHLAAPLPADEGRRLLKFVLSICSLTSCSGLNRSTEFMKFKQILKSGALRVSLVTVWHTALIWIWNLKSRLASGSWSEEGERSCLKWLVPKTLQFCITAASENTLVTSLIQALNSVRLPEFSTLSLKCLTRGWYHQERVWNPRPGRMDKWLMH